MVVYSDMFSFLTWTIHIVIFIVSTAVCDDIYVLRGGNGIIPCPKVDNVDTSVINKYQLTGDKILVKNIDDSDIREYTCTTSKVKHKFLLGSSPQLSNAFLANSYFVGDGITLTCSFKGIPKVQVNWLKNGTVIPADARISTVEGGTDIVQSRLEITKAQISQGGLYKCIGKNSLGQMDHENQINIYSEVRFIKKPLSKYDVILGANLVLTCESFGIPRPVITWKVKDIKIPQLNSQRIQQHNTKLGNYTIRSELTIDAVQKVDEGLAECHAINSFSEETTNATIAVHVMPVIQSIDVTAAMSTVTIYWNTSSPQNEKEIMSFDVEVHSVRSTQTFQTSQKFLIVDHLQPGTIYSICILGNTMYGKGTRLCVNSQTKDQYKLEKLTLSPANITSQTVEIRWSRDKALQYVDPTQYLKIHIYKDGVNVRTLEVQPQAGVFQNSFKFDNLKPYTEYIFQAAEGYVGKSDSAVESNRLRVTTEQDAPSEPHAVRISTSETSIHIKWSAPLELNGELKSYLVEYFYYKDDGESVQQHEEINSTITEVTLKDLLSDMKYYIRLSAKTVKYGPMIKKEAITLEGVPHVAPGNFTLVNINESTVRASWTAVPKYLQGGTVTEYVLKHITSFNKVNPDIKPIIGYTTALYAVVSDLKPYTSYEFSIAASTKDGAGPEDSKEIITLEGPPSQPLNVRAQVVHHGIGQQSIQIEWNEPKTTNGQPTQFQIVYRKIKICENLRCVRDMTVGKDYYEKVNFTRSKDRKHLISKRLDPFSLYSIKVREATNAGWGQYSPVIQIMTNMGAPSEPLNVTQTDISEDSITLQWKPPKHRNGIITAYNIIIHKSFDDKAIYNMKVDGSKSQFTYVVTNNIQPETTYSIQVQAVNTDEHGATYDGQKSELLIVTTTAASKFPWMFILVGCLAVILLIALIVTVFLLLRRQKLQYTKANTSEDVPLVGICRSRPIAVEELKQYCAQQKANSDHGFQQEYESIRIPVTTFTWEHSLMPANQAKNRYSNIVAYDHSRVILPVIDNLIHSDYINASYIDGYKKVKKYIATQGPLPETVIDFWRMVWEQESHIIVMLTKLVEDGRVKCEQYWPEGTGLQYRDIVVTVNSVSEMTDNTVRVFTLHKVNQPDVRREVRQFHYTAWPDHGVPSHPTSLLSFIRHVMSFMDTRKSLPPIIVHCSAGVGRTGTFITIESCLRQIAAENVVDVFGQVYKMRMNRNLMVQVEPQYTLIYNALLDSVVCGNTEIPPADLVSKIHQLKKEDPGTGETHFSAEFKRLETGSGSNEKNKYGDANQPENKQKNRFLNILPFDSNRVRLQPIAGTRHSDYINASIIDGFQQRDAFIAAQAPLENTVNDFWRMLMEQNVHIIVMLTKLEERGQEKCYLYWPQAGTVSYGIIHVELVNVRSEDENNLVINELRLTNGETGRSWCVTQYMYLGWPEYGSPESGSELIHLIGSVQQAHRLVSDCGPILVHCSGGVGRTGVFMAVYNSIERLKAKDVVDVFQTIRQLRLQRTAMVQTIDQYMFCYQALLDYLSSFHLYANCIVNVKV